MARRTSRQTRDDFARRFLQAIDCPDFDVRAVADAYDLILGRAQAVDGRVSTARKLSAAIARDSDRLLATLAEANAESRLTGFNILMIAMMEMRDNQKSKAHENSTETFARWSSSLSRRIAAYEDGLERHLSSLSHGARAIEKTYSAFGDRRPPPKGDVRRDEALSFVWLAFFVRRQSGCRNPIPNLRNGALQGLIEFWSDHIGLAAATAETDVRPAIALIGRVAKGALSQSDRRALERIVAPAWAAPISATDGDWRPHNFG